MIPVQPLREGQGETRPTLRDMDAFVVTLCSGSFVRVHTWFSIGGARELARFKNTRHVLVVRNNEIVGLVDEKTLASAPISDVVTRWATHTTLKVNPETTWQEALRLMRAADSSWLLVATDNFVVGIVTRDALEHYAETQ